VTARPRATKETAIEIIAHGAALLAVVALGLSAGAVVAEAAVLVPFWRSLPPASFLEWYRAYGSLLLRFFGPLEVAAGGLAAIAAGASWVAGTGGAALLLVAAVLAAAVLAAFPLYFQKVNAAFAARTIAVERVADELGRWSRWHWIRTGTAIAAFAAAALAR
jgi:hypothetical protein